MTTKILVEGSSEVEFLSRWCERAGLKEVRFFPHQGKGSIPPDLTKMPDPRIRTLLHQLPAKLRGFAHNPSKSDRIVILVDSDDDDVDQLRSGILDIAAALAPSLDVHVCVATEEIEAFYFGDLGAILRAYPNADMVRAREYVPDSIVGTWELFGEVIDDDSGDKVSWAKAMGASMTVQLGQSRSPSFKKFVATLALPAASPSTQKKAGYRHASRPKSHDGRR
jgi:hypothetical protein